MTKPGPDRADSGAQKGQERAVVRIIVAGGGTGGHVFPAVTAVDELRSRLADAGDVELLWVGQEGGLEQRVAEAEGIAFRAVATGKLRRARNPLRMITRRNLADMVRVPIGVGQAIRVVAGFRPDVVLTTGGYVGVPVGVAAWVCRRPLVIHEQTVRLGLANRLLARVATRVAVSSESTLDLLPHPRRAVVTGNPVRPAVLQGNADKAIAALGLHGFDGSLPTVYVTGGAQGSREINETVGEILPWLLGRANVVHQCGQAHVSMLRERAGDLAEDLAGRYFLTDFVGSELPDVLALADVVISRSGAGTIAELTALGKAAVLIPLASSAGGEQAHNARHLARAGAAVALLDGVSAQALQQAVEPLLSDAGRRAEISERALAHGRPDAVNRLVDVVLAVARG